jgi:hypothetical protein
MTGVPPSVDRSYVTKCGSSVRSWFRLDQFQIGAVNPDGSLGIDDNRIRAGLGKLTYQTTPNVRGSYLMIPHLKKRILRRNAPFLAIADNPPVR